MAPNLTTKLTLRAEHTHTKALDLSAPVDKLTHILNDELTDGNGPNQVNTCWHDRRPLLATAENLDLSGVLVNAFGEIVEFTNIRTIVIHNRNTGTGETLTVGGAVANQFATWVANSSDKTVIGPDGIMVLHNPIDGYAVTAGTGDMLRVAPATGKHITYDVLIWGVESIASISASWSQSRSQSGSRSRRPFFSQSQSASRSHSASASASMVKSISKSRSGSMSHSASLEKSISKSRSGSQYRSRSQSKSWSISLSHSASMSKSGSLAGSLSTYRSQSRSASESISARHTISASRSRSGSMSRSVSISKYPQSATASQIASRSLSVSRSISASAIASLSKKPSVSRLHSMRRSQSQSASRSISASAIASLSKGRSISQWRSGSQSASRVASTSKGFSLSRLASLSQSQLKIGSVSRARSVSQLHSLSQSRSTSESRSASIIKRSLSRSRSESMQYSGSKSVSQSHSASIVKRSASKSRSESMARSISKSRSGSMHRSLSMSRSVSVAADIYQDWTTYTENDPNNRLTETPTVLTVAAMQKDEDCWLRYDAGIGAFGNTFQHDVDMKVTARSDMCFGAFWEVSNTLNDVQYLRDNTLPGIVCYARSGVGVATFDFYIEETKTLASDSYLAQAVNIYFYCTIQRTAANACQCRIYSDAARTTLLDTISIAVDTTSHRYIFGTCSANLGTTPTISMLVEKLNLSA